MSYIYNKEAHTDYSQEYMNNLGIEDEIQESILAMYEFDAQHHAAKEQEWVKSELLKFDEMERKLNDGDSRATMAEEEIRVRRIALRDYVTSDGGVLTVNGERPL